MKLEICIDSLESAIAAQIGGADRVELCANLLEGGTTPSIGTIIQTRKHLDIGLQVIIRPRGGDFCYSHLEFEVMKDNIRFCKEAGVDGIVSGILKADGSIDKERTKELIELSKPMNFTFHRAFDMVREPFKSLEDIISIGADRILTSGLKPTALEGKQLIKKLVEKAKSRVIILAGSGITDLNVASVIEVTGVNEVHMTAHTFKDSEMKYKSDAVKFCGNSRESDYKTKFTNYYKVNEIRKIIDNI